MPGILFYFVSLFDSSVCCVYMYIL